MAVDERMEEESEKPEKAESQKRAHTSLSKVVIRRLPPGITEPELKEQLEPLPPHNYFYLAPPDQSLFPWLFSRAYINFQHVDDILTFRDRFDGYVFVDDQGHEYTAIVELAPCQKVPKEASKKDPKCGTIEQDPEYLKFVEDRENPEVVQLPTLEATLAEIEKRDKEKQSDDKTLTPLLEFVKWKKEERIRRQQEKKKQREEERKRREEERRRREEKERERLEKVKERQRQKEKERKEREKERKEKEEREKEKDEVGI